MKTILSIFLDFLNQLITELTYRLGYLIAELSNQYHLAKQFTTGVEDYGSSPVRPPMFTM